MEENNKITNGDVTAEKKHKGNPQNLTPFRKGESRTMECALKGGQIRGEQIRQHKSLKDLANTLLDGRVKREKAVEILGDLADYFTDDELTNGALMLARVFRETMENGTTKNAEFIRDTSGQSPTIRTETTINGMTDNDRELLRNITERLSQNTDKPHG